MCRMTLEFEGTRAYISASPFVYQVMIGLNELQFGVLFGVNALGLVGASALSTRPGNHYPVGSARS